MSVAPFAVFPGFDAIDPTTTYAAASMKIKGAAG